ncbi:MAG: inositol monophosphatase [Candidatus Moranbacteria bacterium]|nr:inositol monophosphatase [Candidatus Moranbacteria bacterium]
MQQVNSWHKELETAKSIAYEAGTIMRQYFHDGQEKEWKDDGTPVTIADVAINRLVIERISEAFPDDGVIGEEESNAGYGMGRKWFCDPIDGTKAYTWGVATAMFSLGLVVDGVPVVGVAYNPFIDTLYAAAKGQGAHCNGKPIQVSQKELHVGTIALTSNLEKLRGQNTLFEHLVQKNIRTASFSGGVCKCVLVASGRFEGYVEEMLGAYDIAASQVIIEEAGGMVTDLEGGALQYLKPFRGAVASNGIGHSELIEMLGGKAV